MGAAPPRSYFDRLSTSGPAAPGFPIGVENDGSVGMDSGSGAGMTDGAGPPPAHTLTGPARVGPLAPGTLGRGVVGEGERGGSIVLICTNVDALGWRGLEDRVGVNAQEVQS